MEVLKEAREGLSRAEFIMMTGHGTIQDHEFERVGGEDTIKVDVRIISATKDNLENMVANGKFREDLYFRLKVIPVYLPPLRERREDIPVLIDEFMKKFNKKLMRNITISNEAIKCLMSYDYPGNVRELENIIERTIALTNGETINSRDLLTSIDKNIRLRCGNEEETLPLKEILGRTEKAHLLKILEDTEWNKIEAAKILGISRKNLWEKLKAYNLLK